MGFEVFDKRHAPMRGTPSVTVQKRGIVSINGPAHKLIDGARVVELLFDRHRQVMGIRPSEPSPRAYELRGPSKTGQAILSATAFMQAFDVDTGISRRYEPFVEDGMLCVNFAGESTEIRGNRSGATQKSVEANDG